MYVIFIIGSVGYVVGMYFAAIAIGKPELTFNMDDNVIEFFIKIFFNFLVVAVFYFYLWVHKKKIEKFIDNQH